MQMRQGKGESEKSRLHANKLSKLCAGSGLAAPRKNDFRMCSADIDFLEIVVSVNHLRVPKLLGSGFLASRRLYCFITALQHGHIIFHVYFVGACLKLLSIEDR